jgi:hypothetical protein
MKRLAMIMLAFAASLAAADYSGIWSGTGGIESVKYGSVPQTARMTLNQAGSTVTGTLQLGNAQVVTITSGTVSGSTITFAAGTAFTASLTQTGTQLSGKVTSSRGEVMDVVFTKQ